MKPFRNQKGFTLIELLIVVAIIGVLAAVGIPMYNGYITNAKVNASKQFHNEVKEFAAATFTLCLTKSDSSAIQLGSKQVSCRNTMHSWCKIFSAYFKDDLQSKNPWNSSLKTPWCMASNPTRNFNMKQFMGETRLYAPRSGQGRWLYIYTNIGEDDNGKTIMLTDKVYNEGTI